MYNKMASLKRLLQLPRGWQTCRQITGTDGITLHLRATRKTASCPECLTHSHSVHSCRRQQSSALLKNLQHQLGLIAGGEAGRRAAVASGIQISADTLLRRVVQAPEQTENRTRHVGIDEWAWHRGHRYGTLIVNLDTHRPLVLLPGREQRTLAAWFKKYPEIQVVSRDRGGIYALAARDGAPQAIQVADRWHLLKNIGDALERMMYRHMPLIRLVATELSPQKTEC